MKASQLITAIEGGALSAYTHIYADIPLQTERYLSALREFITLYGDREARLFSVPGRTEVMGNHTDHNGGFVLAGSVDLDIIAVASPTEDGVIRLKSEGYDEDTVEVTDSTHPARFEKYTSRALIAGTVAGFRKRGYAVGGFVAYTQSCVLRGSGLSSSAAFEVMIGNILSHLYVRGDVPKEALAQIAREAECVYFGKPCGLMDQMACALGGLVFMDLADAQQPTVEKLSFSLKEAGLVLCVLNTGGDHADLNEDYAAVPADMKRVANYFGKEVLRGVGEAELIANAPVLRRTAGDRALLRALHFVRENERVQQAVAALKRGDVNSFLQLVMDSGNSSYKYLQNVYTVKSTEEQGLALALALADGLLSERGCAYRVHGGGFAGTTQAFVRAELAEDYRMITESVFGTGACLTLSIRPVGATEINIV